MSDQPKTAVQQHLDDFEQRGGHKTPADCRNAEEQISRMLRFQREMIRGLHLAELYFRILGGDVIPSMKLTGKEIADALEAARTGSPMARPQLDHLQRKSGRELMTGDAFAIPTVGPASAVPGVKS